MTHQVYEMSRFKVALSFPRKLENHRVPKERGRKREFTLFKIKQAIVLQTNTAIFASRALCAASSAFLYISRIMFPPVCKCVRHKFHHHLRALLLNDAFHRIKDNVKHEVYKSFFLFSQVEPSNLSLLPYAMFIFLTIHILALKHKYKYTGFTKSVETP